MRAGVLFLFEDRMPSLKRMTIAKKIELLVPGVTFNAPAALGRGTVTAMYSQLPRDTFQNPEHVIEVKWDVLGPNTPPQIHYVRRIAVRLKEIL